MEIRQISFLVKLLIIVAGIFLVLASIAYGSWAITTALLAGFLTFWALLQSVGRDPSIRDPKAKRYFRFIILEILFATFAIIVFIFIALANGEYINAAGKFVATMVLVHYFWKYRKELKRAFEKN